MKSKRTAKRLILFLTLFIVINLIMSIAYVRFARTHEFRLYDLDKSFAAGDSKLKYLFIGDSHMFMAVEADSFPSAFDYSSPGEHPIQTYYKLKHVLENHTRDFDTLVMNLDLHQYRSFQSNSFKNTHYWAKYIDFWELGTEQGNRSLAMSQYLKGRLFPYYDGIKYLFRYVRFDNIYNFTKRDFSQQPNHQEEARLTAQKHLNYADYLDPICLSYLHKMFALCKKYHKSIVFVKLPLTEDYFLQAEQVVPVDSFYQKMDAAILPFRNFIRVIDDQKIFFGQDQYFCDPHHVNGEGKKVFSKIFKKQIQNHE